MYPQPESTQILTIQEIRKAKAGDKPRRLYDRDGLYLVVTAAGGKLWRGKYRVNGREKALSLGPYPKIGLAEAQTRWSAARELDEPSAAKRAEKRGSSGISPEMVLRLSKAPGRSPESWRTMQHNHDLWQARQTVNLDNVERVDFRAA